MSSQYIWENKSASSIFLISKLKMRANQAFRNRYILIKRDQVAVVISYEVNFYEFSKLFLQIYQIWLSFYQLYLNAYKFILLILHKAIYMNFYVSKIC